jgi:Helicase associated domain
MYQVPLDESLKTSKGVALYNQAKEKSANLQASGGNISAISIQNFSEAKNVLDADKIVKLSAIGFEWDLQKDSYVESWENRYNELMKYKIVNGNCRVPKTSTEYPQLGHWVKQMRKYRSWKEEGKPYPATFTDERIRRLDELGFEWRLKEGTPGRSAANEQNQIDVQPPPQMAAVAPMPMVDPNQGAVHNGVHNPAYVGGNMNVNVNDPARQFEMDPNQYQQYHQQQGGGWQTSV